MKTIYKVSSKGKRATILFLLSACITLSMRADIPVIIYSGPASLGVLASTKCDFGVGTNYGVLQWQYKAPGDTGFYNLSNGGQYSNVTTQTLTVMSSLSLNGYKFRCKVGMYPGNTKYSNEAVLRVYCSSRGLSTIYEYIQGFSISTTAVQGTGIIMESGNNGGYFRGNEIAPICNLNKTIPYSMALKPGFTGSSWNENWRVWMDFNADGDFADAGELVAAAAGSSILNTTFTIPANAPERVTNMRISMEYGSAPSYCDQFSYGEVEEYYVYIRSSTGTITMKLSDDMINGSTIDENDPSITINEASRYKVDVYPNPSTSFFQINVNTDDAIDVRVADVLGAEVIHTKMNRSEVINTENLTKGIYFVSLSNAREVFYNKKIVVEK